MVPRRASAVCFLLRCRLSLLSSIFLVELPAWHVGPQDPSMARQLPTNSLRFCERSLDMGLGEATSDGDVAPQLFFVTVAEKGQVGRGRNGRGRHRRLPAWGLLCIIIVPRAALAGSHVYRDVAVHWQGVCCTTKPPPRHPYPVQQLLRALTFSCRSWRDQMCLFHHRRTKKPSAWAPSPKETKAVAPPEEGTCAAGRFEVTARVFKPQCRMVRSFGHVWYYTGGSKCTQQSCPKVGRLSAGSSICASVVLEDFTR